MSRRSTKEPLSPESVPMELPGICNGKSSSSSVLGWGGGVGYCQPYSTSPGPLIFWFQNMKKLSKKSSSEYFCLVSISAAFFFETFYNYLFYIMKYKMHTEKFTQRQHNGPMNYPKHPCNHQAVQEVNYCLKFLYVPSCSLPPLSLEKVISVLTSIPTVYFCLFLNFRQIVSYGIYSFVSGSFIYSTLYL